MKSAVPDAITSLSDQEIFKALMESVGEAVFVIEPHTLRILDVNGKASLRLGYSAEEMLALKADRIFTDCVNPMRDAANGETATTENRLVAKDGQAIAVALTIRQIKHLPHPVALIIASESAQESCLSSKRHSVAEGAQDADR